MFIQLSQLSKTGKIARRMSCQQKFRTKNRCERETRDRLSTVDMAGFYPDQTHAWPMGRWRLA